MSAEIIKKLEACIGCGAEYEAHIGNVLGIEIQFGRGYCQKCCHRIAEEEDKKEAESVTKKLTETREQWRRNCGIPLRFIDSRLSNFDVKVDRSILRMRNECDSYIKEFSLASPQQSKSIVMYSHEMWGLGKTRLVCAIANGILDKWNGESTRCPVYFVSEPKLFLRVKSTYDRRNGTENHETEDDIYNQLTRVPLLILDDVGKEEVADPRFVQRMLFAVIDGRYGNILPMVITANLDTDGLARHLGGDRGNCASMERLMEMTGNIFWELKGVTYRDLSKRVSNT